MGGLTRRRYMTETRKHDIAVALLYIKKRSINAKGLHLAEDRKRIHDKCAIEWQLIKEEVRSERLNFYDFIA